jgi:hypothetical protein
MYTYLSTNWLQENDATHPGYISGPIDTQKVKVQFSPIVRKKVKI